MDVEHQVYIRLDPRLYIQISPQGLLDRPQFLRRTVGPPESQKLRAGLPEDRSTRAGLPEDRSTRAGLPGPVYQGRSSRAGLLGPAGLGHVYLSPCRCPTSSRICASTPYLPFTIRRNDPRVPLPKGLQRPRLCPYRVSTGWGPGGPSRYSGPAGTRATLRQPLSSLSPLESRLKSAVKSVSLSPFRLDWWPLLSIPD